MTIFSISRLSKRSIIAVCVLVLSLVGLAGWSGCRNVPLTGRKQLMIIPEKQEISMGIEAYQEILSQETLSTNERYIEMVNRVGRRIAAAADRPEYDWEFNVIASPQQNAFALPGGKVAIYEGILPLCENEAGLAVVMSHEVAHALARHGGERMGTEIIQAGGQKFLEVLTRRQGERERKMISQVYGVASQYGAVLPFSRKQELEADQIGLMLMARAGYNPEEAPRFWERFSAAGQQQKPAEFFSTHPSDVHRAADLRALLPEALELYQNAPNRYGVGQSVSGR
jgi:predicted Zn-dependent protease